jgi:alpha-amylase
MRHLPAHLLQFGIGFKTPSETIRDYKPVGEFDVPWLMSWADLERDLSAWRGNEMQEAALKRVFALEDRLKNVLLQLPKQKQEELLHVWRMLQTSDHFYYMCTKYWNDGDVHAYFSPYESPYDAFITYMNTLSDFESKLERLAPQEAWAEHHPPLIFSH